MTYTRTTTVEEVTYEEDLTLYSDTFNTNITPFMKMRDVMFDGIFTYTNGSWLNTCVGISTPQNTVFNTSYYYSDFGVLKGTFDRTSHKEDYVAVSLEEPTDKKKIWFKPIKKTNGDAYTSVTGTYFSNSNYTKYNYSDYARFIKPTIITSAVEAESTSKTGGHLHIVVGDYLYLLAAKSSNSITNRPSYKINLNTGARTTITSCPYTANTNWANVSTLVHYNGYIYVFSNTSGVYRYSISGNSWSNIISSGCSYNARGYVYGTKAYLFNSAFTGAAIFDFTNNTLTAFDIPEEIKEGKGHTNGGELFVEEGKMYMFKPYDNRLVLYDFVNNVVEKDITIDSSYFIDSMDYPTKDLRYGRCGYDYTPPYITGDGKYAYFFGEQQQSQSTMTGPANRILIVDIDVLKEALSTNDGSLLFTKKAFTRKRMCMYAPYLRMLNYHNDAFYGYNIGTDTVIKITLDDLLEYSFPETEYATLMFELGTDKYDIKIKEKERIMLNNMFMLYPSVPSGIILGNIYLYDEANDKYNLFIENVSE